MNTESDKMGTMTAKDLESEYGRCIPDKELARYLGLDIRTLRKYADKLCGVAVLPNKYVFFEKVLQRRIYAQFSKKTWENEVSGKCADTRSKKKKKAKALPRRQQKIIQKCSTMGKKDQKRIGETDRHDLLDCNGVGRKISG